MAKEKTEDRQKAKSKGFAALGVPVGAVLTYRKDPKITATVVDDKNKVEYKGKVYPISGLAKELMQCPISGYHAFKYNGVLLAKLGSDDKPEAKPAAESPPQPQQAATVASGTATSPKPQTVPLPAAQAAPAPKAKEDIDPLAGEI
jgi:hypothetical protein